MNFKKTQGFTLIELMIVVAIIAVLAAIAIPQYRNYVIRSQVSRIMSESGQLRTAIETCYNEGRFTIGNAAGECDPGGTDSNLIAAGGNADTTGTATSTPVIAGLAAGGDVTITSTFGRNANGDIAGDNLVWTRTAADGSWACTSSVAPQWIPTGCN